MLAPSSPIKFRIFSVIAGVALITLCVLFYQSLSNKAIVPDVTFVNLKGEKISAQSLRGKVVMVNFWATSCTTCVAEMPRMIETYNKYHVQGLEFVAVAMSYDPPNYVLNYTETRQLPFNVALDIDGALAKAFGEVKLTPTTYIIDKQGNILKRYVGEPSFTELHALLEKALAV
ncbi:TlpA disulfide reductase family protein [Undibacterium sp. RTI2.1]|uniref:TlpA family protein disulfide reductase n=1 Tax=unclassified Undibacterium TaxID=2630295 RepID=UPI002AB48A0D|nr:MULTISPECIES: TlpA disulfide reductase family protein [unclassified Undibacterium]MDY7539339.1 TlpA disulfide reductase family protein [Undibacterium sp. 5I1]MEB0031444.1 TlpA disulfide reductase family protein [Undibacterium sp. RTI2.1]MEB0117724.1 TlpA disulfide reductase family protein [Undibacterium sp. RTI2.2]MEB0231166.1 TlpA disulfide reductase family protein [Undibacterium sp. 10I3]MEB0258552.1 TlpA disulfide reductase family protein [Undibacterium sp. 5I1]